jgi:acyl-CoA thioesterase FadM
MNKRGASWGDRARVRALESYVRPKSLNIRYTMPTTSAAASTRKGTVRVKKIRRKTIRIPKSFSRLARGFGSSVGGVSIPVLMDNRIIDVFN